MINRVTHQTIARSTLANLQGNMSAMSALQAKMSSGKNISVPSDDPAAASDMLRLRGDSRAIAQYQRNAADAGSWLTTADTALTDAAASLREARDLTVQGGDGALGLTSRQALATQIDGVRDALLAQANASYAGRTVFAGTSNTGQAFAVGTDPVTGASTYTYSGTGSSVDRRLGTGTTVRVDVDGAAAFGSGDDSVFKLLDDISATLRDGGDPTESLGKIDSRMQSMLGQLSGVGVRHKQVLETQTALTSKDLDVKTQLSGIEDIDLAEVILELQTQEVAYNGALGAAAKVLQPTLLDFLR